MTGMSMIEQPTAINVNPLSIFPRRRFLTRDTRQQTKKTKISIELVMQRLHS